MHSIIDEKKTNKKTPSPCKNKQDYVGGTNDKTRESDDSPSDTDGCARNLDDEHKIKKMTNTLNLHMKKIIELNQKLVKG